MEGHLKDWKQPVKINNIISDQTNITCGMSQQVVYLPTFVYN